MKKVLKKIGLIINISNEFEAESPFPKNKYVTYIISRNRTELEKEMDNIYGVFDEWVLHKETGLRIQLLGRESSFDGSVSYKAIRIFIRMKDGSEEEINDINLKARHFKTKSSKIIPFSEIDIKMAKEESDW